MTLNELILKRLKEDTGRMFAPAWLKHLSKALADEIKEQCFLNQLDDLGGE